MLVFGGLFGLRWFCVVGDVVACVWVVLSWLFVWWIWWFLYCAFRVVTFCVFWVVFWILILWCLLIWLACGFSGVIDCRWGLWFWAVLLSGCCFTYG